jgi:hypothetical protein
MISNISSTSPIASLQQYPAARNVPSSPKGSSSSNEDSVQLSEQTQRHLADTKASGPPPGASLDQIIKEAAGGDITAIAKLALVG